MKWKLWSFMFDWKEMLLTFLKQGVSFLFLDPPFKHFGCGWFDTNLSPSELLLCLMGVVIQEPLVSYLPHRYNQSRDLGLPWDTWPSQVVLASSMRVVQGDLAWHSSLKWKTLPWVGKPKHFDLVDLTQQGILKKKINRTNGSYGKFWFCLRFVFCRKKKYWAKIFNQLYLLDITLLSKTSLPSLQIFI